LRTTAKPADIHYDTCQHEMIGHIMAVGGFGWILLAGGPSTAGPAEPLPKRDSRLNRLAVLLTASD